jgi:pyruvate/2-oxoglutarate dehydrogenase complex dihydrolipoamide acyltransferase (E2) component
MAIVQNIQVPLLSVNDTSLTVTELSLANGSVVKKGDLIMVFETSKTTYDVVAEGDGFVKYTCIAGNEYEVNQTVAIIYSTLAEVGEVVGPANEVFTQKDKQPDRNLKNWSGELLISRKAQALIDERMLDRSLFAGKDFVTLADVEEILGMSPQKRLPSKSNQPVEIKTIAVDEKLVLVSKLSGAKKKEIEYLTDVQGGGLTSTVNINIETSGIFEKSNSGLKYFKNSLLPLVIYESARLLRKYPVLNAYFADNKIATYRNVNIGFAIDIDKGLKVVKIADTDTLTIPLVEEQMLYLSGKYIDDTLIFSELSDVTFTITDLSAEGISFFRPLINRMNSSILGISSIDTRFNRCILSLSFDHRVTEGKVASRFLADLKSRIESYKGDLELNSLSSTQCYKCMKTLQEDLGDVGFVKCITPKGKEAFICESCLKGF